MLSLILKICFKNAPRQILGIFVFLCLFVGAAEAALKVDVTRGVIHPITFALTPVLETGKDFAKEEKHLFENIQAIIAHDLENSGLFQLLDRAHYLENFSSLKKPSFMQWRTIRAQALAVSQLHSEGGNLDFSFHLWDIDAREQLLATQLRAPRQQWRSLAHKVADAIYEQLTGEKGYFNTHIIYVSETGPVEKRVKRLAIMDQDGANVSYLTDGREIVLSPRFNPSQQMITYLSYGKDARDPKVYILDLGNGYRQVLGRFPGMTFAPRFSPDGRKVVMSYFANDASNIYTVDLKTRRVERLTHTRFIDTAPCYSPDGRYVVFESDRNGRQQLYIMDADGRSVRRLTFGEGSYATPVWSPRGDLIAFTKIHRGEFMIGVMRPNGTGERILARGFHNEAPTWAPNGRVLMFFRETPGQKGGARIWAVDLTGHHERELETATFASDPAWSPKL